MFATQILPLRQSLSAYSGDAFDESTYVLADASGTAVVSAVGTLRVAPHDNASCTSASNFALSGNTASISNGTAVFSSLKYLLPTSAEKSFYLLVEDPQRGLRYCSPPVSTLHHFKSGYGFQVYNQGAAGVAGGTGGLKQEIGFKVLVDSESRILIAGYSMNSASVLQAATWRYLTNGTLDTSYASIGATAFSSGGNNASGQAITTSGDSLYAAIQDAQRKYVVVGSSRRAAGGRAIVFFRYNENGSLDTSFNSVGYSVYNNGGLSLSGRASSSKVDELWSVLQAADGGYVGVGETLNVAGGKELVLVKYTSSGILDTTFGTSGIARYNPNGTGAAGAGNAAKVDQVMGAVQDRYGNILVAGHSLNASGRQEPVLWRYTASGVLDPTFASGTGYQMVNHNSVGIAGATAGSKSDQLGNLALDDEGRIVAGGVSINAAGGAETFACRFKTDGSLDLTFSATGCIVYQHGSPSSTGVSNATKVEWVSAVDIDSKGRIVFGGGIQNLSGGYELSVRRYLADGTIDTSFGQSGVFLYQTGGVGLLGSPASGRNEGVSTLQVDAFDRIVASGYANSGSVYELPLLRLRENGTLDR